MSKSRRSNALLLPRLHRQVKLTLALLVLLLLFDRFLPWGDAVWGGALSACLAPLVVLMLRLVLQAAVGHRKGGDVGFELLLLGLGFAYIYLQTDFTTYWHWGLTLLFLLASFLGVFWWRISTFVMVVMCAAAGTLLY